MPDEPTTGPESDRLAAVPEAVRLRVRRLAWVYAAVAIGLLPWIAFLAISLPRRDLDLHYRLAWVGFDCLLVGALARTAYTAFRLDPSVQVPATATATLLLVDAWFDVTTAGDRSSLIQAILLAVFAELPAAALSLYVAHRVNHGLVELAHLEALEPHRSNRPHPWSHRARTD